LALNIGLAVLALALVMSMPVGRRAVPLVQPASLAVLAVLLTIAVYYVTIALHELGHLAGGVLAEFRFVLLSVGPLLVTRQERGLRVGHAGKSWWLGGLSFSVPLDDLDLRRRMALLVAGGPCASLLQVALAFGLRLALRRTPISLWLWLALALLLFFGLVTLLLSAWPSRLRGMRMDRATLCILWRGGPPAERLAAIFALAGASASGERPRERNPRWVEQALSPADGSLEEAAAAIFAYAQALDQGESGRAAPFLDRALALWPSLPPLARSSYALEAAYFEARHRGEPARARAWLEQAGQGLLVEPHTRLRAEAAVLLAEGDREAARARAEQGLDLLGRSFDRGYAQAQGDWLREIAEMAQDPP
jgi:hypothetical protein